MEVFLLTVFACAMVVVLIGFPFYVYNKIFQETTRLKNEINSKANACTVVPTKAVPFSRIGEANISDIVDYYVVCNEIEKIVGQGRTAHSSHTVQYQCAMFKGYVLNNYVWRGHQRLAFWIGYHWMSLLFLGFQAHAASKLELIFNEYFRGDLIKNDSHSGINTKNFQASSSADEIAKLHKLKQDGILSDDEFQTAKRKLVG